MGDVGLALTLATLIGVGADALDTENFLPEPPQLILSIDYQPPFKHSNAYCYHSDWLGRVGLEQTLWRYDRTRVFASYTHYSCYQEEADRYQTDAFGIGVRIDLDFF